MRIHPVHEALAEARPPLAVRAIAVALGSVAVIGLFLAIFAAGARIVA